MKPARYFVFAVITSLAVVHAGEPKPGGKILFQSDFKSAKADAAPESFMILGGEFKVQEIDGKKILELPGSPLDDFGALFGPAQADNVAVRARIRSEGSRRLAPRFGVGLNGASGYRLLVVPSKKEVQLFKDQEAVASAPFEWESGAWTWVHLQVRKVSDGNWKVEGKAWTDGKPEPKEWAISIDATTAPTAGKASVWGAPYSGKPIQFDDLSALSLAE